MKIAIKPTYLLLVSAMALASCSQDDMPGRTDAGDRTVVFHTSMPDPTSRATIITADNLPYFRVSAFDFDDPAVSATGEKAPLFDNEKITVVANKDAFISPFCRWPEEGKESDRVLFFGFYPESSELGGAQLVNNSTAGNLDYKLTGIRVAEDIAVQKDFVTAYTDGNMADHLFTGVTLPFAHQLSRIEIKAYGANKSCDIEIAGVRIGGAGVEGTFDFQPVEGGGHWYGAPTPGIVEYIYGKGDKIVKNGKTNPVDSLSARTIMGRQRPDGNDNCAMLIPSVYTGWKHGTDRHNDNKLLYISVLLRVTDAPPTAGINPVDKQRYPYTDLSQGADALEVPVVYLATDKTTGEVLTRLYKKDGIYVTNPESDSAYTLPANAEIKEFGWAALPVSATWQPGYIYTYKLDYTLGVGLLDPEVSTASPGAGDPVISDKVGISYTVKEWKNGGGNSFVVPGS